MRIAFGAMALAVAGIAAPAQAVIIDVTARVEGLEKLEPGCITLYDMHSCENPIVTQKAYLVHVELTDYFITGNLFHVEGLGGPLGAFAVSGIIDYLGADVVYGHNFSVQLFNHGYNSDPASFIASNPVFSGTTTGNGLDVSFTSVPPIPEPASWALMFLGFGVVGYAMRRRRAGVRLAAA